MLSGLRSFAGKVYARTTCRYQVAGKRNRLEVSGARLRHVRFDVEGDDNVIELAPGCSLRNVLVYVRGSRNRVALSEATFVKERGVVSFYGDDGVLSIGRGTTIESARLVLADSGSSLRIGEDCMLAYDVEIRTSDAHSVLDAATGRRVNPPRDVELGRHVWLGARTTILKGVRIGENSIVAAGATVTTSCGAGVVVAGCPARVVREGVNWDRRRLPLT